MQSDAKQFGRFDLDFYIRLEWMLDDWLQLPTVFATNAMAKPINLTLENIRQAEEKLAAIPPPKCITILCHPIHLERLNQVFGPEAGNLRIYGVRIKTNKHLPKWRRRWVPPYDRFIEFEPSDTWLEKLGLGHYEDTDEPYILEFNDSYVDELMPYFPRPIIAWGAVT